MAKVKRSVLKEIVKECLLEILFEGIDSESGYEEEEPIREARTPRRASRPSQVSSNKKSKRQAQKRQSAVEQTVSSLTQDPVMAAIYADTANTTLLEQKEGRPPPADNAAAAVDNIDNMEDLFEGASDWAAIAFNETQ